MIRRFRAKSMSATPTIGVLIPTRNCAPLLPEHIASLLPWIDRAQEIVVVDSDSQDGTVEMLRASLPPACTTYWTHPPGLYQSWNYGIQKVSAKYVYIATVGDAITRPGLEHLLQVAEEFQCDLVISKPRFVNAAGHALPDSRWLIDEILEGRKMVRPELLSTADQFLFTVTHLWCALPGSSASNLYRTDCLRQRPFPLEFGTAGDGAWGVQNIFDFKIAVTPQRFSTFRLHPKAYSLAGYHVDSLALKMFRLAQNVIAQQRSRNPALPAILEAVHWAELEPALNMAALAQDELDRLRRAKTPWILQPSAWRARLARGQARRKISQITRRVLAGAPAQYH
jgi:hypothetical protein